MQCKFIIIINNLTYLMFSVRVQSEPPIDEPPPTLDDVWRRLDELLMAVR